MKISFVGDIMLGRFVGEKFSQTNYQIVSSEIVDKLKQSDYTVANLESPIIDSQTEREDDHLRFLGESTILEQFDWVSCFSLSNNHINDCGTIGMDQTISALNKYGLSWNGLYKDEYIPFLIEERECKIAIVTCDDLMNIEFSEDCPWKTLRVGDLYVESIIKKYKEQGYFIILYAHVGMLFTRFPSPAIRDYLHEKVDLGVDLVVTVHSHALGGMEEYNGALIFHSLGDFVMDGSSFRRRKNYILNVEIEQNKLKSWEIVPTVIDVELQTIIPSDKVGKKLRRSFKAVSSKLDKHRDDYFDFYKVQYKKEMLSHSLSTLHFIFKTKGVAGLLRLLSVRIFDVFGMINRVLKDKSKMRYDVGVGSSKHKMSNKSIK